MRYLPVVILTGTVGLSAVLVIAAPAPRPLDPVLLPLQALFIGLFVYHLALVALGTQTPAPAPPVTPSSRFVCLVTAHNEEAVIGQLIGSLKTTDYPAEMIAIHVVADHCTDRTAEVARAAGARVFERNDGERRGKGPALEWLMQRTWEMAEVFDAVVIFDADNLAAPDFLRKMDAYLHRGDQVIQGYLGTKNPNDSWVTRAIYASYAYTNRFFQLSKQRIGLSSALGGTGLCIAVPLLRRLGWRCEALTEDLEFQIRAILHGIRPAWGWDAIVYDEKPLGFRAALRQRQRWMQGHANVAVRYLGRLIRYAVVARDPVAWDAVVYLANPFWLALAVLLSLFYVLNSFVPLYTYLYPWWLPPALILASLIYPYVALQLEGQSTRPYLSPSSLVGVLALALCWPPLGLMGLVMHRRRQWVKTVHTRSLSIAEAHHSDVAARAAGPPPWGRLRLVRATAGGLIVLALIATITPHLGARRLRPPLEEGATLLLERDTERALEQFKEAAAEQPNDPIAHGFLAVTYRMRGDLPRAANAYYRLKRLDPSLGDTAVAMADFFLRHRSHPRTPAMMQELLGMVRSGPDAYVWLAGLFLERRRAADAETVIRDGLARYARPVSLLKFQGFLYYTQRRYSEAITVLSEATRKAPTDPGILINLGWAQVRLRRYPEALRHWERALEIQPHNPALRRDVQWLRRQIMSTAIPLLPIA